MEEEEGIIIIIDDDQLQNPLSGLFESYFDATAIDEYYVVVIELLKEWSTSSFIYLWVSVSGAIGAIPSLLAALIEGILDVCKNRYYFYGAVVCMLLLVLSLYWLVVLSPTREQKYRYQLKACYKELYAMVDRNNWQPLLLRLAWSDAVSHDCMVSSWPHCGGVNGSIRFDFNLDRPANAGLSKAIDFLKPLHYRYPIISWADLIQMAGVVSIKACGGPTIPLVYGRWDAPIQLVDPRVTTEELLEKATNTRQRQLACSIATSHIRSIEYPSAVPPFPEGAPSADVHLRAVFYRLGFNNRETVALCGAHTIGRAFADRSGVCTHSSGDQGASRYTKSSAIARFDQRVGVGMSGGCSWTSNWLHFDNEYFRRAVREGDRREQQQQQQQKQKQSSSSSSGSSSSGSRPTVHPHGSSPLSGDDPLLWLPMDAALFHCPEYRPYFMQYAHSLDDFYRDYCAAHIKMSELGASFRYRLTLQDTTADDDL